MPLAYRGGRVGELVVGVRAGQRRLDRADRAALELLAAPLAVAVHATALSEDVQRSREQIVAAREEERVRLRRDLHDGLGPALTGISFQADAAGNLLASDPGRAGELLGSLRMAATEAIADVRRLVYALRPPALDELGLVGALRRHAEQLDGAATAVAVHAPQALPPLPAAVEVAAYRIVVEALTNAVRHAGATRIEVRVECNGALELAVDDDGGAAGELGTRGRPHVDAGARRRAGRQRARRAAAVRRPGLGEVAAVTGPEAGDGEPVRVVLADDHPVVRDGLSALLSSVPGIEVVGTAATGREAVREAVIARPDVLVLDVQMPDLDGVGAAREIARAAPSVSILMLTMFDDDDSVFAAMRAGARGYVLKGATQDEIVRAIHAVAAGEAIFGPGVARRVLGQLSGPAESADPFPELTPRERQVLEMLAAGLSSAAIGARLELAPKTVTNHASAVFAKLRVAGRAEAVERARRAGLGRGEA